MPILLRFFDKLLMPAMWLIGGCRRDSIQETHRWHCNTIDNFDIDISLTVVVPGDSDSRIRTPRYGSHHFPIFDGWRSYVVIENTSTSTPWYIGWQYREAGKVQIHRLPIFDQQIRMLKWPVGTSTTFFAISEHGEQLPIGVVDSGRLGDGKYPNVRLF